MEVIRTKWRGKIFGEREKPRARVFLWVEILGRILRVSMAAGDQWVCNNAELFGLQT
jgi:hypothetical protein